MMVALENQVSRCEMLPLLLAPLCEMAECIAFVECCWSMVATWPLPFCVTLAVAPFTAFSLEPWVTPAALLSPVCDTDALEALAKVCVVVALLPSPLWLMVEVLSAANAEPQASASVVARADSLRFFIVIPCNGWHCSGHGRPAERGAQSGAGLSAPSGEKMRLTAGTAGLLRRRPW